MPAKKVSFGKKPVSTEPPIDLEGWVNRREGLQTAEPPENKPPAKMKRLTLDIPEGLH